MRSNDGEVVQRSTLSLEITADRTSGNCFALFQHNGTISGAVRRPVLAGVSRPGGDLVCEGLFHGPIHLPPQFTGSEGRTCPRRQRRADAGRVSELVAVVGSPLLQLAQQLFGNGAQAVVGQRTEYDDLVQTACQLWPEPLLCLLNGLRRLLFKHGFAASRKTQRRALPRQKPCAEV